MKVQHREHVAPPPEAVDADARALALELGGLSPRQLVDPVTVRLVLENGEQAWRRVDGMWLRVQTGGQWSDAVPAVVLITDRRLLLRLATGEAVSLWWGSVVGYSPDLVARHVVLDFGDGSPRALSGEGASVVAVAGVASLYGLEALTTHPSIAALRQVTRDGDGAADG